ncbi:thrombospondin type-1 domain-containing protein 7B isoform X1 [Tachysurus ichikawai]
MRSEVVLQVLGYRERRRRVLGEGSGSSDECGHLLEFIPCEDPVCFQWRVEDEGECVPNEGTCGSGSRSQTVACVNSEVDSSSLLQQTYTLKAVLMQSDKLLIGNIIKLLPSGFTGLVKSLKMCLAF